MSVAAYRLIQDYLDQGDLARASTELVLTGPGEPESAEYYVLRAQLAWSREDFQTAIKHVERALEIDPNHDRAFYYGATAAIFSGNDQLVFRYGFAALMRGQEAYDVLDGLAASFNRLGLPDFAICAETRAMRLDLQSAAGYFNFGRSLLEIGDLAHAQIAIRTCETAADPRLLWPYDCSPTAKARLESAVTEWPFAAYQIGVDEIDHDSPARAHELLSFAYDRYSADNTIFMAGLAGEGLCLAAMNTRDKALIAELAPLCEAAIERYPAHGWPTLFLAAARFTGGDPDAALTICREVGDREMRQVLEYDVENAFLSPAGFDDAIAAEEVVENPIRFREERPLGFDFDVALDDRYPEIEVQTEGVVFVACTGEEFERQAERFLGSIDRLGKPALVHFHLAGATDGARQLLETCRTRFTSLAINLSSRSMTDIEESRKQSVIDAERIWVAPAVLKFYGCSMLVLDVGVSVETAPEEYLSRVGAVDVGLTSAGARLPWLVDTADCAVFGCSARAFLFLEIARRYVAFVNEDPARATSGVLARNALAVARAACREVGLGVEFRNLNDWPAAWSRPEHGSEEASQVSADENEAPDRGSEEPE